MKKILCLCLMFLLSAFKAFASDIKFVQIDDLRYSPLSEDSVNNFKNTVNEINKLKGVDFVVFTGNNIAKSDKEFLKAFLKRANKLHSPYYIALGHKDLNKKKGLSKAAYMEMVMRSSHKNVKNPNYVFKKKGVVFLVSDGAKEFIATPFGYYRDSVISWADKEIKRHHKNNVIVLQHFPVYPPNESEAFRTYKGEEYLKMLETHGNVKAVVSGFNINSENDINGIKHITTAGYPHYRIVEVIDGKGKEPTIWSTLK